MLLPAINLLRTLHKTGTGWLCSCIFYIFNFNKEMTRVPERRLCCVVNADPGGRKSDRL